jgi:transcriptional regulator with XRE-family HTH domain
MEHLFGDKLRWLRQQRRMTQVEAARHLGLATQSHISYLERGRSAPSLELAIRVAELFGVTTDYLLQDTIAVDQPVSSSFTYANLIPAQRFGPRLRQLRKQHGMTQVELAAHIAPVSQAHVSFLEAGRKTPSIDIVLECCKLFRVTADDLLRGVTAETDLDEGR